MGVTVRNKVARFHGSRWTHRQTRRHTDGHPGPVTASKVRVQFTAIRHRSSFYPVTATLLNPPPRRLDRTVTWPTTSRDPHR